MARRFLGALKDDAMEAGKLGLGASVVIAASDFLQSKVLVSNGVPLIPAMYSPVVTAVFGFLAGGYVAKKVDKSIGTGAIAGGVGMALAAAFKMLTDGRTMAAVQGESPSLGVTFGFGRAFASGARRSLAGYRGAPRKALYGVGTPDMRAAGMFGGATVAIEETGRRPGMAGATVQFEPSNNLAGIFS